MRKLASIQGIFLVAIVSTGLSGCSNSLSPGKVSSNESLDLTTIGASRIRWVDFDENFSQGQCSKGYKIQLEDALGMKVNNSLDQAIPLDLGIFSLEDSNAPVQRSLWLNENCEGEPLKGLSDLAIQPNQSSVSFYMRSPVESRFLLEANLLGINSDPLVKEGVVSSKNKVIFGRTDQLTIKQADQEDFENEERLIFSTRNPAGIAIDNSAEKIYWTEARGSKILKANLDGSRPELVLESEGSLRGIHLDLENKHIYWTTHRGGVTPGDAFPGDDRQPSREGSIWRSDLNGENAQRLIDNLSGPVDFHVDTKNDQMYWIDMGTARIQKSSLAGESVSDLVTNISIPPVYHATRTLGFEVDQEAEKMYWSTYDGGIYRSDLDGENIETLLPPRTPEEDQLNFIMTLAIDKENDRIFWGNGSSIQVSDIGVPLSNTQTLTEDVGNRIRGLTYHKESQRIFWTDFLSYEIASMNADGTDKKQIASAGIEQNPHIDLLADKERGLLFWSNGANIFSSNLDGSRPEEIYSGDGPFRSLYFHGLATHKNQDLLYWVDQDNNLIFQSNLNGDSSTAILDAEQETLLTEPVSLVVDSENDKIIWIDQGDMNNPAGVFRADLDGANSERIATLDSYEALTDIALNEVDSNLYISVLSEQGDSILRITENGLGEVEDIAGAALSVPTDLRVDRVSGELYWINQGTDDIQMYSPMDGSITTVYDAGPRDETDNLLEPGKLSGLEIL